MTNTNNNERDFRDFYGLPDDEPLPPRLGEVTILPPTVQQAGDPRGADATWTLMPAPAGVCSQCARDHEPEAPHDALSLHYQVVFNAEHGRAPTWADAMAHCAPGVRALWTERLVALGETVERSS
jgi:hypothetical protein